eukprot:CAMPEP_0119323394 /NCGR_PEP_ID=MMETSP1333-20130426/60585_1 /TAXON_ID=418940 /ORGANISM="Scyphosphaera apsteinii, Strain RCC1455" /LENGTH=295 /DNA_ID=CAMNT_0007330825 /DNA_START=39 /DNA_END=926 /DNA_ORIENTATION=-
MGELLRPHVVKAGWLTKHAVSAPSLWKNWKRRYILLLEDGIAWHENEAATMSGKLMLSSDSTVQQTASKLHLLRITGSEILYPLEGGKQLRVSRKAEVLVLASPNKSECDEWATRILQVIRGLQLFGLGSQTTAAAPASTVPNQNSIKLSGTDCPSDRSWDHQSTSPRLARDDGKEPSSAKEKADNNANGTGGDEGGEKASETGGDKGSENGKKNGSEGETSGIEISLEKGDENSIEKGDEKDVEQPGCVEGGRCATDSARRSSNSARRSSTDCLKKCLPQGGPPQPPPNGAACA